MGSKFYIATADRGFSEERTLRYAKSSLLDYLKEGEEGTIDCFQYYDGSEGEYMCVWHRGYKKVNNKLELVEAW